MFLPESIRTWIDPQNAVAEDIGMSGASVLYCGDLVLKTEPANSESDNNLDMLRWLRDKLPVPEVLAEEVVGGTRYLVLSRLKGRMACDPELLSRPQELVKLLADGLRQLWAVDPGDCPRNQMLEEKLKNARYQVEQGLVDLENVDPETFGENGFDSPAHLLQWLEENRPSEEPVLSHGDFCLPNLFCENGAVTGFLDLGRSGIADKWLDIAILWRSLRDNLNGSYGYRDPGFDPDCLFDILGIEPHWAKIRYYLLLDELF